MIAMARPLMGQAMSILLPAIQTLGQIVKPDSSIPVLEEGSPAVAFIIAGVMVAAIMLIGFKQSRRNHLDKAD
jgi:hypothetical protein